MNDHWIMHIPVISTAHITPELGEELTQLLPGEDFYGLDCAVTPHGAFLYFHEGHETISELPACLRAIGAWANGHLKEFDWVRLDSDGDVIDALPQYDW